jgi:hypothetical protein
MLFPKGSSDGRGRNNDTLASSGEEIHGSSRAKREGHLSEHLQAYARNLSERIIPRGVETHEVVGIVLLLRDVLARSLFAKYQTDFKKLNRILDAYEPAANRIANTVAVGFVQRQFLELSTPVLQVRERLLILPIIGVIDPQRARQLTEQLLRGIRTNRAKVVVIDITGVAAMDATVANHLVQTVYDGGRYMVDDFTLSYAPSASVYVQCCQKQANRSRRSLILGIPDSQAPSIRREIQSVATTLPDAEVFVGARATAKVLREKGAPSGLIHIATHGFFRQDSPIFSGVRMGDTFLLCMISIVADCRPIALQVLHNSVAGSEGFDRDKHLHFTTQDKWSVNNRPSQNSRFADHGRVTNALALPMATLEP